MNKYPHDEFDDVDEDSKRRGVYRAINPNAARDKRSILALIGAGLAALILGGFMYVFSPQNASPEAATQATASSTPSASETASAEPIGEPYVVEIYNSGGVTGAASDAMNLLMNSEQNVEITQVGNWHGVPVNVSTIYYTAGNEQKATAVAEILGVDYTEESTEQDSPVVAVLGPEYVLSSLRTDEATDPSATASATDYQ
ncbi:LytR C-terminal domain-containing protein [Rothia terrae]|uniref:LytR C-terminal domain-containing protein n=1 Tax=Rothia terrae TaxID=396015 RepID=A0A7H2BEK0_9MICC|nr:LytR C-terminal domain-containing protein [Rothia terrae]MDT0189490.1 LytR C-terminal domain-containing protein [Rothia terrae]QNV38096.1 LytR C-terminal domain-containing protein [Rothia terrae]